MDKQKILDEMNAKKRRKKRLIIIVVVALLVIISASALNMTNIKNMKLKVKQKRVKDL